MHTNVDILKKEHLPLIGVGPIIVIPQICITFVAILLSELDAISSMQIAVLKIPFMIIAIALIILGMWMWCSANFKTRIDSYIGENHLATTGVYSIVRNPIYTAFFLVCTGALLIEANIILFILPVIYYLYMTMLIINTEEKWLCKLYGNEYMKYCKSVNRCIPWFTNRKARNISEK